MYEAPLWTPHHVRDLTRFGTDYSGFSSLSVDVNGDGLTDHVSVGYFSRNVGRVENPGEPFRGWTCHEIDLPGSSETASLVELTGDGGLDPVCPGKRGLYWFEKLGPGH